MICVPEMISFVKTRMGHVSLLLGTALVLAACAGSPTPSFNGLSMVPPPDPVPEEKLLADDPVHEIWVPGYWSYDGRDFSWVPGRLTVRPNPTAVWSNDRWERRGYGWAHVGGYWQ